MYVVIYIMMLVETNESIYIPEVKLKLFINIIVVFPSYYFAR